MLMAVFSDVHGNLPALQRFLEAVEGRVDGYVCLGDVVNYGPWSDECLELIFELPNLKIVRGNHEDMFLGKPPLDELDGVVGSFTRHCLNNFTRFDLIQGLLAEDSVGRFRAVHTIDGRRVFPETDLWVEQDHLIGHSHWQYAVRRGGLIINPGSVGQNRQDISHVDFALLDTSSGATEFCSIPYDVDLLLREVRAQSYPVDAIDYFDRKVRERR